MTHFKNNACFLDVTYNLLPLGISFTINKFVSRQSSDPLQNEHYSIQQLVNFKSLQLKPKLKNELNEFLF
jgi:hypothetical protein